MIETASVPDTGTAPGPTRRRFLSRAGGVAAMTALAGTGVLTWRTATQGVLAPATGPAYDPWRQFHAGSGRPRDLVAAAGLAPHPPHTPPRAVPPAPGPA